MDRRNYRRILAKELGKLQKRLARQTHLCLVPDCRQHAIASHSQQRAAQLRSISRDGMVYAMERNYYRVLMRSFEGDNDSEDSPVTMRLQGIGAVSTFPGFCSSHDASLFRRLDQRQGGVLDDEQAWALFLRTFAYEYAQKRHMSAWMTGMREIFIQLDDHGRAHDAGMWREGIQTMLETDAPAYFAALWAASHHGFAGFDHFQHVLPVNAGISTACVFSPLDFLGRRRAEAAVDVQPMVIFNLIPSPQETLFIASVQTAHTPLASWIAEALTDETAMGGIIDRCAFIESEDTSIAPELWEALSPETQRIVCHAMRHELFRGPMERIPSVARVSG